MILVTGGTGLIGSHLLLELLRKNLEVKAIYRNQS
ncbi:NAD-dependent epimerase/dehydratase family protein, partial [Eudoraea sp.]